MSKYSIFDRGTFHNLCNNTRIYNFRVQKNRGHVGLPIIYDLVGLNKKTSLNAHATPNYYLLLYRLFSKNTI
jgi:hypothetical protein